jgi:hypothetical protein
MTGNDCIIKGVDMQSITIMRSSSSWRGSNMTVVILYMDNLVVGMLKL